MSDIVAIKSYSSQIEGEAAKIVLAENGIKSTVCPAGMGTRTNLIAWLAREVDLIVAEEDVADAAHVLQVVGNLYEAIELGNEKM